MTLLPKVHRTLRILAALLALGAASPLAAQLPGMSNVVINQIQPDSGNGQGLTVELYNYGPTQAINGWNLEFLLDQGGPSAVSSIYVFPAGASINRLGFVRVHWAAGSSTFNNFYRGAGALPLVPSGELRLCTAACASNGVDYMRWGASAFSNRPPNLAFRGNVSYGAGAAQGYMERLHDANSRSAADWTINQHAADGALNPGQYGTRRHALLLINEVSTQGGTRGVEIANPQEFPVEVTGMTLVATQKDGFFCQQQPLTGMIPAGGFYMVSVFGCAWAGGPGEAMITDAGGEGIDYMSWGGGTATIPTGTLWTGGNLPSGWQLYYRTSTLDSDNFRDFSTSGGGNYSPGSPNPQQQFGAHYQEFGGEALTSPIGSGFGAGTQVTMTQTAALTEFRVRANNNVSQSVGLAVYQFTGGVWTLMQSVNLGSFAVEDRVFYSGPLNLTLTAGVSYRFMIYGSTIRLGQYRDGSPATERFRYGTVDGFASDSTGFLPASMTSSTLSTTAALQAMAFSMVGTPVVEPPTLPDGQTGVYYAQTFTNSEGSPISSWSYTGTPVPGLTFNGAAGTLTGYPTTAGSYSFTISANGPGGLVGSRAYTINVTFLYGPLSITTGSPLPNGQLDTLYSLPLAATGGDGSYTWSVSAGALPGGVELTPGGTLSGIPTSTGSFNFTARVQDGQGAFVTKAFTLSVTSPLRILNSSLPAGYLNVNYPTTALAAAGGSGTGYSFSLIGGLLPPGITFTAGSLSGKPTVNGSYPLTFRVTDSFSATATRSLTLTVTDPPPTTQWEGRALFGGTVSSLVASPNFTTDSTAFASGSTAAWGIFEVYRTDDGGMHWTRHPVAPAAMAHSVERLVVSPAYDRNGVGAAAHTLFAFNSEIGVWRSTDDGNSFTAVNTGLPNLGDGRLSGLAISPNYVVDSTLWVTYSNATPSPDTVDIYISYNGGNSWSYLSAMNDPSFSLRAGRLYVSPTYTSDSTLFALVGFGIGGNMFLRSLNGGISWSSLTGPSATTCGSTAATFANVILSPRYAVDRTLFVEDSCGVITRSQDAGASFAQISQRGTALAAIARPGLPPLWYVKNPNAAYGMSVSDTQGASFTALYAASLRRSFSAFVGPQNTVNVISPVRRSDGTVYLLVGTDKGVDGSYDDGQTFNPRELGLASLRITNGGFPLGVRGYAGKVVALSEDHWLYSDDGGTHWVRRLPPWPPDAQGYTASVDAVAIAPSGTGNTIYVAGNQTLYRSTDSGTTFTQIPSVNQYVNDIAFANGGATVYIGAQAGLFRSTNSGVTFSLISTLASTDACTPGGSDEVRSVGVSPNYATDSTLYVGTYNVCRSVNAGTTWTVVSGVPGMARVTPSSTYNQLAASNANNAWTLYAGGNTGVLRSQDRGTSWVTTTLPTATFYWQTYVTPTQATDHTVYAFSTGPGATFYRSTNDGTNWAPLVSPDELLTRRVTGVEYSSATSTLVATDGGGLWRSSDGGATFQPLADHQLLDAKLNALAMRPITTPFAEWVAAKNAPKSELPTAAAPGEGDLLAGTDQGVFISTDGGESFDLLSNGLGNAIKVSALQFSTATPASPVLIARDPAQGSATAQLFRLSGTTWAPYLSGGLPVPGRWSSITEAGGALYATRLDGIVQRSTDGGVSWSGTDTGPGAPNNVSSMAYNNSNNPTLVDPFAKFKGPSPNIVSAVTAPYWSVSATTGARFSDTGVGTWTAAPGTNEYVLPTLPGDPSTQMWRVVQPLGINAASGSREVLSGSDAGLYRTLDGGVTWRRMDGAGSGLELTSRKFTAVLTATTPSGGTDVLVGATGSTDGGVYLSGDGGEHWTQVNAGFDPANLSISSLVKTSCTGCPVSYYSGSYGSGVYTRTITVNPPPAITGWCFGSTSCSCGTAAMSGPEQGGQAFKLCGTGFLNGLAVEFDGIPATGCTQSGGTVATCTGTPPHAPLAVRLRVRNSDTRAGYAAQTYLYLGGAPRTANSLRIAKSGADAALTWSCSPACTAGNPARVYRAQNSLLSLYPENYNGGASGAWANTGAVATPYSYFWSVE